MNSTLHELARSQVSVRLPSHYTVTLSTSRQRELGVR